jgi:Thiamine pyrophosphate enzyme, C-terminal TPP binding domain
MSSGGASRTRRSSAPTRARSRLGSPAICRPDAARCTSSPAISRRWRTDFRTRLPRRSRIPSVNAWDSSVMAEFATCVKYQLPVRIVVLKNNSLGQIKWGQMVFLGNPEYGCDLHPIDFAAFARVCGGTGFTIARPRNVVRRSTERSRPQVRCSSKRSSTRSSRQCPRRSPSSKPESSASR